MRALAVVLSLVTACGGAQHVRPASKGAVLGLVRDQHTGEPVAMADLQLVGPARHAALSNEKGIYEFDQLSAGTYTLTGTFAGQPITISNIAVRDGEATYVDLMFTLGDPQPITVVFGDTSGAITHYTPKTLAPTVAMIEGTVSDVQTRERVVGAVVTAIPRAVTGHQETEQTVTDDAGRFAFPAVAPGTYTVSAYYSIGGRAQVEVQRNQIEVAASQAVVVPIVIEMGK